MFPYATAVAACLLVGTCLANEESCQAGSECSLNLLQTGISMHMVENFTKDPAAQSTALLATKAATELLTPAPTAQALQNFSMPSSKEEFSDIFEKLGGGDFISSQSHNASMAQAIAEGHRGFACGTLVTVMLVSAFALMSLSANTMVAKNSWVVLDYAINHYIAVMWLLVVMQLLDALGSTNIVRVTAHAAVAFGLVIGTIYVEWQIREDATNLAICDAITNAMVLWGASGFVDSIHDLNNGSAIQSILATIGVIAVYSVFAALVHNMVSKTCQDKWGDAVVNRSMGAAIAISIVNIVNLVIAGEVHHFAGQHGNTPSASSTFIMLATSAVFIGVAIFVKPQLDAQVPGASYWTARALATMSFACNFLPRFSFVASLGSIILANVGLPDTSVVGHIIVLVAAASVGILLIFLCASFPDAKNMSAALLPLGGFVVGGHLCNLLDNSISMVLDGAALHHAFLWKVGITVLISIFVFPAYAWHIKPMIMQKTK